MSKVLYCGMPKSLPFTIDYTPTNNTPVLVQLSGTAYSNDVGIIGLKLSIDNQYLVSAGIWSNQKRVHRELFPGIIEYDFKLFDKGSRDMVKIKVEIANSNTVFDGNDFLSVVIFD